MTFEKYLIVFIIVLIWKVLSIVELLEPRIANFLLLKRQKAENKYSGKYFFSHWRQIMIKFYEFLYQGLLLFLKYT